MAYGNCRRYQRLVSTRARPAGLLAALLITTPVGADDRYDYPALVRILGQSAGQAAACGLDAPDVALSVATRLAAAIGRSDDRTAEALESAADASRRRGCREYVGPESEFRARWRRQKRRVGLD